MIKFSRVCSSAVFLTLVAGSTFSAYARDVVVSDQDAFKAAVADAEPGDAIIMADGVWRDFEMVFEAKGNSEKPITLRAQTNGGVILSGQSNLRIAGDHLVVKGLVFKDGYTPTNEVISFRKNDKALANNTRVTEVVIDNYNNPERYEVDFWVMMYGKNNRFDHNHLSGKKNKGVTMAVRLNTEASQENSHRIDHNYFGPRPVLGSNGGETLRIGTSHFSLTNSNTVVENNMFDRCDGELEIISVKSGGNVIRGNSFYESRGTLTMRHGNNNIITENVFFGNGVDHTGGIRVINKYQTITNNYMEGLTGYRFGGAFVVMNGVPDSPINRYHQVDGAKIDNNTIVNSDHIQLGAGSDQERSAVPVNSTFEKNLISHEGGRDVFTVYDDMSGLVFADNFMHSVSAPVMPNGISYQSIPMRRAENGLLYPVGETFAGIGASRDLKVIGKDDVGAHWYPKTDLSVDFGSGKTVDIKPGDDTLTEAIKASAPGDTIILKRGRYSVSRTLIIPHPLTIKSKSKRRKPQLSFSRTAMFEIADGGSLQLENLAISGAASPDNVGNALIRTSKYAMLNNYRLHIINTDITDLDVNRAFDVLYVSKSTMADEILIKNSTIKNVTGAVLKLNRETDDFGIFNADYVRIQNSKISDIGEEVVNMYRGGTDESTFGPHLYLEKTSIENAGFGKRNKSKAAVMLHGVQVSTLTGNEFSKTPGIKVEHTVSEPVTKITSNSFVNTPVPTVAELYSEEENTAVIEDNKVEGVAQ